MGGVYANFANVSHSDYEFTVTFARVDHEVEAEEVPGVVVSRVNLSPRFMRELIDAMEDNYSKWQTREGIKNLPEYGGADVGGERGGVAGALLPSQETVDMKVAVISDIHANLQAFEAVLEAVAESDATSWCLGDSSATAPTRTRASSWPAARGGLPGRKSRPRGGRRAAARRFHARGQPRGPVDPGDHRPENLAFLAGAGPQGAGGGRPLPRQPARPGLGVRALGATRRALPRHPAGPLA